MQFVAVKEWWIVLDESIESISAFSQTIVFAGEDEQQKVCREFDLDSEGQILEGHSDYREKGFTNMISYCKRIN